MAVRKDGERWSVEFQAGGTRVHRRLPPFASRGDALALEARLRRELWERRALGRADEPSLAAAVQLWLEETATGRKDTYNPRRNARHLAPMIEGRTLREVGDAAADAVREWEGKLAPATINRRLDVLRAASRHAWKRGWIADNVAGRVPHFKEHNSREVYLTAAEVKALADAAPNRETEAAIMLAAYTGMRASELLSVGPQPKGAKSILVRHTKTGKARKIPVHARARPYLVDLPIGLLYRTLIGYFWKAREKAGMKQVRWHDLRHTTASLLINSEVDLFTVGKILGHTSPQTTARYAHLADAKLRDAMRKVR